MGYHRRPLLMVGRSSSIWLWIDPVSGQVTDYLPLGTSEQLRIEPPFLSCPSHKHHQDGERIAYSVRQNRSPQVAAGEQIDAS
jgi:hypothetical protein